MVLRLVIKRLTLFILIGGLLSGLELVAQSGYQVVVHASNPASSINKADLAKLLLKKTKEWSSGLKVLPVDQASSRSVRETFSRNVHGKSVSAVKSYWQKLIFTGRETPPVDLASDSQVLQYVRDHSGAIGYVSSGATVGSGVKVIRITS